MTIVCESIKNVCDTACLWSCRALIVSLVACFIILVARMMWAIIRHEV